METSTVLVVGVYICAFALAMALGELREIARSLRKIEESSKSGLANLQSARLSVEQMEEHVIPR